MSETINIERERVKMDIKTLATLLGIIVSATAAVCSQLYQIRADQARAHEDCVQFEQNCVKNFGASWQVRDEVERVHQQKENHGVEPEVAEVLRITRPANQQTQ